MRKITTAFAMVALIAAACSTASAPGQSVGGPSAEPRASASSQAARANQVDPRRGGLEVGFGEFAISLEAKRIRPGRVTFVIHNGGKLVHGFEIKAEGGSNRGHGGGGDRFKIEAPRFGPSDTIRIPATLPVGVYEIECYVANHDALGMRTRLRVERNAPFIRKESTASNAVLIKGFRFDPQAVHVTAGSKVTWTNADPTQHTVTAKDGSFTSKPLPSGKGYVVTFARAGQFTYYCAIHPTMTGTIRVTG